MFRLVRTHHQAVTEHSQGAKSANFLYLDYVLLQSDDGCEAAETCRLKLTYNFLIIKICKSVHHRTIQINHQPDATIFQFIILTFIYSSTCFGRSPAHHQELSDCSGSLWFYLRIVVRAVLSSWSGRPDHEHTTLVGDLFEFNFLIIYIYSKTCLKRTLY